MRDMLLGKRPHDYDVGTDALPDEVLALFPGSLPTGIKHGTVTVVCARRRVVEVTTFRSEGAYLDRRRPESVSYIGSLTEDLKRRDFTMNAIAVPLSGLIIDPFGGRADINAGLIRCVGEPEKRFGEDALRMFRALRFSARLGFEIEEKTAAAISAQSRLTAGLSAERVCCELEAILMSNRPELLSDVVAFGLLDSYTLIERPVVNTKRIGELPKNKLMRWAGFCALLESEQAIASAESFLRALKLDRHTINHVPRGVTLTANRGLPETGAGWKRLAAEYGLDTAYCAAAASDTLTAHRSAIRALKAVLKSGECFTRGRLAVTGDDLVVLGLRGVEVGQTLRLLLDHVIERPEDNRRDTLLEMALTNTNPLRISVRHEGKE